MDRRTLLSRGGLIAALGLAGCSGSPDETGSPTDAPTDSPTASSDGSPTNTPTDGSTPTDTPTDTASPSPTPPGDPDQRVVVAPDGRLRFSPDSFAVETGATVLWEWEGNGHNVSPESQPDGADWPGRDDTLYGSGTFHAHTFEVAGEYEYHCDPHQSSGMRGSFTVE